jgi:hypothetical protein
MKDSLALSLAARASINRSPVETPSIPTSHFLNCLDYSGLIPSPCRASTRPPKLRHMSRLIHHDTGPTSPKIPPTPFTKHLPLRFPSHRRDLHICIPYAHLAPASRSAYLMRIRYPDLHTLCHWRDPGGTYTSTYLILGCRSRGERHPRR